MTDLDELLVHKLDTPQARRLEELDLRLDEQVKRDLGHKQARARAGGVTDGGADVLVLERLRGIDIRERISKDVIENVVDPCATVELFGGDVNVRTLDRRDEVTSELGHEPEDEPALLFGANVRLEGMKDEGWMGRTSLVSVTVNCLITK